MLVRASGPLIPAAGFFILWRCIVQHLQHSWPVFIPAFIAFQHGIQILIPHWHPPCQFPLADAQIYHALFYLSAQFRAFRRAVCFCHSSHPSFIVRVLPVCLCIISIMSGVCFTTSQFSTFKPFSLIMRFCFSVGRFPFFINLHLRFLNCRKNHTMI